MRLRVGCRQRGPSCGARKDGALLAAGVHAQREDRAANAQRGISKTRSYSLRITPFGEVMRLTSRGGEGASGVKSRFFTIATKRVCESLNGAGWRFIGAHSCAIAVATRPAEVAERLVSTRFSAAGTRGFASPNDPKVAVCLRPGTELAFEHDVQSGGMIRKIIGATSAVSPNRHRQTLPAS
jgi:hypothetical protein